MKIVSIGEVLWDVIGDKEHLGGAPFNFAAHARNLGHDVYFVSAIGCDERGDRVLECMSRMGLPSHFVRRAEGYPTGTASVTLDAGGQPSFRIHRPAAYDFPQLPAGDFEELCLPPSDWIYFGTLHQMSSQAREVTAKLLEAKCGARHFYDLNLRPSCYEPELVRYLMSRATVVKLNDDEVPLVDGICGKAHSNLEEFCRNYAADFSWEAVCVTRGAEGCVLLVGEEFISSPGYGVKVVDAVGAGDACAAAFLHGLGSAWRPAKVADFANRVGAIVTSRPGAIPSWTMDEINKLGK